MNSILKTISWRVALDHNYVSKKFPAEESLDYLDKWLDRPVPYEASLGSDMPENAHGIAINVPDDNRITLEADEEEVSVSKTKERLKQIPTGHRKLLPHLFNLHEDQQDQSTNDQLNLRLDDLPREELKSRLDQCAKELNDLNYTNQKSRVSTRTRSKYHEALDRHRCLITETDTSSATSLRERLCGGRPVEDDTFTSPFMGRLLRPYIFRDSKSLPLFLKLMLELKYQVTGQVPERSPIDYCYIRHGHIAAVNSLLEKLFWPGIDMSECLSYPEFSVVALYKRLVIGCGFLIPDVDHNEAYISFLAVRPEWQRSGIAKFMLYHLIQTCVGKDITLHVSATNPAVCLYQKFGFKIVHLVLDFYENYMAATEDRQSRHALFLRLKKS